MAHKTLALFLILLLFSSACRSSPSGATSAPMPPPQGDLPTPTAERPPVETASPSQVPTEGTAEPIASGENAVLLFTIGMHIEPFGETVQGYRSGQQFDYHNPQFFQRQVQDILTVAHIVEAHGGHMTIQTQSPFTSVAIESGNTILADLAARGHEIALHFHEDAHLGKNPEMLSVQQWCDVMKQEIALITQASGVSNIRCWSGGNLYPSVYEAAQCAGLDVNSDWKNPELQETPLELVGVHPWRLSSGADGVNLTAFITHDPNGAIIFLPEGQYDKTDFASMRRSEMAGGDEACFEYLKTQLYASLAAAQPGQVNVFHFTVHPGEFRGNPAQPFAVIEKFLTDVVDPLVASGQVQWATFSQMADAYAAWEQGTPGTNARDTATSDTSHPKPDASHLQSETGYISSFIINVHDRTHPAESADILLKLVNLFEKYGVRGDFYFTPQITRELAENHPKVIERFRNSNMTISYHVRPPHPLYTGFDDRLKGSSDDELYQTLLDYETCALDLETGELDRSQPGGYSYVAQVFGRNPVVAPTPNNDPRIKDAARRVYASLGAQMTLLYHEEGTKLEQPFEYVNGLLVRPSDFSVTHVTSVDGSDNFWWNFMSRPNAADYNPTRILQNLLAEWVGQTSGSPAARAPFITALIHENNFCRNGAEGWTSIYFTMNGAKRGAPLPAPWNLNAPDPSKPRTEADQSAIFAAYEELVAYAAQNLSVVTSEDIVNLAKEKP